jgi:hypothetical protein
VNHPNTRNKSNRSVQSQQLTGELSTAVTDYSRAILQGIGLERKCPQQSRLSTIAIAHKGKRKALTRRKLVIAAI